MQIMSAITKMSDVTGWNEGESFNIAAYHNTSTDTCLHYFLLWKSGLFTNARGGNRYIHSIKYAKLNMIFPLRHTKITDQLKFRRRFPKGGPTYGMRWLIHDKHSKENQSQSLIRGCRFRNVNLIKRVPMNESNIRILVKTHPFEVGRVNAERWSIMGWTLP